MYGRSSNLTQTTSGSYLLLSSLDISRRNLALRGRREFEKVIGLAEYAREEINNIGGYYAFSEELVNGNSIFAFDRTKLSVHTLEIGLAGIESMTFCGMNMTSRSSLATSAIFWLTCLSGTADRRWNVW